MPEYQDNPLGIIWEVKNIAAFIGLTPRQTFNLLHTGKLPGRKVGEKWCAKKDELTAFFASRADD